MLSQKEGGLGFWMMEEIKVKELIFTDEMVMVVNTEEGRSAVSMIILSKLLNKLSMAKNKKET